MVDLSRRRALGGALVLAAWAAGCGSSALSPEKEFAVLERRHNARVGLFAADLNSGRIVEYRADDTFAMLSTFKTYAAAAVLQRCDRGELRLDERVFVNPAAVVANSPVTEFYSGDTMTLADLCAAALQLSDNTAGNLLLTKLGSPAAITSFARSIGDDKTRLDRWETELNSALPGDPRDTSTPRALARGYQTLLTGATLAVPSRQQLNEWMRGNLTSSMGLRDGWTSADKTGSGDYGSTNDVGIVYGPDDRKLLLAMMTRSADDDPKATNLRPLIGELTALVLPMLS